MAREIPTTIAEVIKGVSFNVYQGQDGIWHAHVSGLSRDDEIEELMVRDTSIGAEYIAHRIERDVADGADLKEALKETRTWWHERLIIPSTGSGGPWVDVGSCSSEDEARERACHVIGHVFGRRLAKKLQPYTPPPKALAGVGSAQF